MVIHSGTLVLPTTVLQFLEAVNAGDVPLLLQHFAQNAVVNDQLQEWRGLEAIEEWCRRDVVADNLSLRAVECVAQYGHCALLANADGAFDKRGLPDPLAVHLYFTFADNKIAQLIVVRDTAGLSGLGALLRDSR